MTAPLPSSSQPPLRVRPRPGPGLLAALAALALGCGSGGSTPGADGGADAWNRPPAAPTAVVASPDVGRIYVGWLPPVDHGDDELRGFVVRVEPGGRQLRVGGDNSATVDGLRAGVTYTATVSAVNFFGEGPASAPSNAVTLPAPPPPPAVGPPTPNGNSIQVQWTAPPGEAGLPVVDYVVSAQPGGGTVVTSSTSATLTNLVPGATYSVTVVARNAAGSSAPAGPFSVQLPGTVPLRATCREHLEAGLTTSGIYPIQPGSVPMQAFCDLSPQGQGRTLLAHFTTSQRNTRFDPARAEVQDATSGHLATPSWAPQLGGAWGHLPLTEFAPSGREVVMECGTSRSSLSGSFSSQAIFADFSSGTHGAYGAPGSPGWGVLAKAGSGAGRTATGACGASADPDSGGIGYCDGPGEANAWGNHLASFSDSPTAPGPSLGCNGVGCVGGQGCNLELWVWLK